MTEDDIQITRKAISFGALVASIYCSFVHVDQAIYFILLAIFIKLKMQK